MPGPGKRSLTDVWFDPGAHARRWPVRSAPVLFLFAQALIGCALLSVLLRRPKLNQPDRSAPATDCDTSVSSQFIAYESLYAVRR